MAFGTWHLLGQVRRDIEKLQADEVSVVCSCACCCRAATTHEYAVGIPNTEPHGRQTRKDSAISSLALLGSI
eukprot:5951858-Amphidinium_carterae.1